MSCSLLVCLFGGKNVYDDGENSTSPGGDGVRSGATGDASDSRTLCRTAAVMPQYLNVLFQNIPQSLIEN